MLMAISRRGLLLLFLGLGTIVPALAQLAGVAGHNDLVITDHGKTSAVVVVSPKAAGWERRAAEDLLHYIDMMSGAKPALADTPEAMAQALRGDAPVFLVGAAALDARPALATALSKAAKKAPVLRSDAITLCRDGNRVYLAGNNDESHYYAVAELLQRWGCRWYMPGDFGECIPEQPTLTIGALDYTYGSPFEVRKYWLSWHGDGTGKDAFMRRNMMNDISVPSGHCLGNYVKELIPPGKTMFNIPIAEEATAQHVAKQLAARYAKGEPIMLGMEDGIYRSDSPVDAAVNGHLWDKYMQENTLSDNFMLFYNNVARALRALTPDSPSKIGFLAYSNITIPPQRDVVAEPALVAYLAPIDIDPIHGMDDPRSLPRREYKEMMSRWAEVMQGRVVIYDYDQGMLVWRDIPCPSVQAVRQDVQHYRKAGILGVDTESRGGYGTIFLNLYLRGQLLWNPDMDVDAALNDFYPRFYGPAAAPMQAYWTAINKAWEETLVTEHEFFLIPAIYTPELVTKLRAQLELAEAAVQPLATKANLTRNEQRYLDRVRFTRAGFAVLDAYVAMATAAAGQADYRAAVDAGVRGLAARNTLAKLNPIFTSPRATDTTLDFEGGPAWWPGEVDQYRELQALTDGTKGTLITILPLTWAYRRDPLDTGVMSNWARKPADLTEWEKLPPAVVSDRHRLNPGVWEPVRTDLYLQAQGISWPDYSPYNGYGWYRTTLTLPEDQRKLSVHLMFPGLFNECWLYLNGALVAYRAANKLWWMDDYRYQWDVDLTGKLQAGANTVTLRINNPHHMGGIFRRPFLYRPEGK